MKRRAPLRNARRRRSEAGETLLELLMTVTILGIAVVGIMGGIGAVLRFSVLHRDAASADVVLGIGAEAIKATAPQPCSGAAAPTASYQNSLNAISSQVSLPAGWTVNSTATSNLKIISAVCDTTVSSGVTLNLQTITLTAKSTKGTVSETVEVLKRNP